MKKRFRDLAKQIIIKLDIPTPITFSEVYVEKAKKTFLCAHFQLDDYKMCLFDPKEGPYIVSRIDYHFNTLGMHISHFKTESKYQSKGLGRKVYDLALAHADLMGHRESHGYIMPTGEISALSNRQAYDEYARLEYLKNAYISLGNEVSSLVNDVFEYEFSSKWQPHEQMSKLSVYEREFIRDCRDSHENEDELI